MLRKRSKYCFSCRHSHFLVADADDHYFATEKQEVVFLFFDPPTFKDEGWGGGFPFTLLESFFASPLPSKAPTTALGNDYCDVANRKNPLPLSLAEITTYGLRPQKKAIRPAVIFPHLIQCHDACKLSKKIKLCTNPVCRHVARSCSVCH